MKLDVALAYLAHQLVIEFNTSRLNLTKENARTLEKLFVDNTPDKAAAYISVGDALFPADTQRFLLTDQTARLNTVVRRADGISWGVIHPYFPGDSVEEAMSNDNKEHMYERPDSISEISATKEGLKYWNEDTQANDFIFANNGELFSMITRQGDAHLVASLGVLLASDALRVMKHEIVMSSSYSILRGRASAAIKAGAIAASNPAGVSLSSGVRDSLKNNALIGAAEKALRARVSNHATLEAARLVLTAATKADEIDTAALRAIEAREDLQLSEKEIARVLLKPGVAEAIAQPNYSNQVVAPMRSSIFNAIMSV